MTHTDETSNPCVTWLLPIKNGMPYLPETLASIEAQTYRNWQILAWDNGSTDGTLEELRRWIPSRLPGRIVSDRPMGLGASLAEMVKDADTELCARIDADDVNLPDRLQKQVAFLQQHPNIVIVGTQIILVNEAGIQQEPAFVLPCSHEHLVHFMLRGWGFYHPTVLFRRDSVLDAGNYRDVGTVNVEDVDLWFRLMAKFQGANLADFLLKYRVHSGSVTVRDLKQDVLRRAGNERFCEHAPQLFGITCKQALRWREWQYPCALFLLMRIAKHLQQTQGTAWKERMLCPWFIDSVKHHLASKDIITRLALAAVDRRPKALTRELQTLGLDVRRKFIPAGRNAAK